MKKIAVFASGSGTNAGKIMDYFSTSMLAKVALVVTNNPTAGVIEKAKKYSIPVLCISKKEFTENMTQILKENQIDFIVLAGFLWLIPANLIKEFPNKIINIHPSLLPKFGGKGMYGMNVHKAVLEAKENQTGITIHYVSEEYDKGQVIFQASCEVLPSDKPEDVAKKVQYLEHQYFPAQLEKILSDH